MLRRTPASTSVVLLLCLFVFCSLVQADAASSAKIVGVPRVKQLPNYCGPACLTAVMQFYGKKITQEEVGRSIYDASSGATSGADLLVCARDDGFAAYSWNSSISDAKGKLDAGVPVIALQQNSLVDTSGHYRVLTGYDDAAGKFYVMDPYYDNITELSYRQCEQLWKSMGFWALLVAPASKDRFKEELDARNPVVHMDLSYAMYKRKHYDDALREAKLALKLEPGNSFATSLVGKIHAATGAGAK